MPDSNVMIKALADWQADHELARAEIEGRLRAGEAMVLAGHAVLEAFSVLTRIPAPYRIPPAVALRALRGNYLDRGALVSLNAEAYPTLLADLGAQGVAGGRTYDALIARCAESAAVDVLVTFNARHFEGLLRTVAIHRPGDAQHRRDEA
ncbi:MAG: PIN domain-containing protein [Chloroflexi bacterium]|nr:PIN domain-containing protein [Chloroflexota bacterium]